MHKLKKLVPNIRNRVDSGSDEALVVDQYHRDPATRKWHYENHLFLRGHRHRWEMKNRESDRST